MVELGVWVSQEGQRRPSSSFILATVSVLEPRLSQLMPIVVDLSSNPDRVIKALGLNFSPDEELEKAIANGLIKDPAKPDEVKLLPPSRVTPYRTQAFESAAVSRSSAPTPATMPVDAVDLYLAQERSPHQVAAAQDAVCCGVGGREPLARSGGDRLQAHPQIHPPAMISSSAVRQDADLETQPISQSTTAEPGVEPKFANSTPPHDIEGNHLGSQSSDSPSNTGDSALIQQTQKEPRETAANV